MLGAGQLEELLNSLGARQVKINSKGTDIISNCPFQRYKHSDGEDSRPSFGISLSHDHKWHCFACGVKGRGVTNLLASLVKFNSQYKSLLDHYSRLENSIIHNELLAAINEMSMKAIDSIKKAQFSIGWDEEAIEKYKGKIPMYLVYRIGYDLELEKVLQVARMFTLGYDEENKILIIPVRNRDFKIVGIGRRFIEENQYIDIFGWEKGSYLYGEQFFDNSSDSVYIVEGYFDVWRMYALGYENVYAVMGNNITDKQARKIAAFGRNVYIIPDGDEGGQVLLKAAKSKLLPLGVSVFAYTPLQDRDPCHYSAEQLKWYIENSMRLM